MKDDEEKEIKDLGEALDLGRAVDRATEKTDEQVSEGTLPQAPPLPIGLPDPDLPQEFIDAAARGVIRKFREDMEEPVDPEVRCQNCTWYGLLLEMVTDEHDRPFCPKCGSDQLKVQE